MLGGLGRETTRDPVEKVEGSAEGGELELMAWKRILTKPPGRLVHSGMVTEIRWSWLEGLRGKIQIRIL